jgi:hypothetical protein
MTNTPITYIYIPYLSIKSNDTITTTSRPALGKYIFGLVEDLEFVSFKDDASFVLGYGSWPCCYCH